MKNIPSYKRTKRMIEVQKNHGGVKVEELLRRLYVDENKSIQQIADHLSIGYQTVLDWLKLANITSRKLDI